MTKLICNIFFLSLLVLISACYTDDSSIPNADRIPFEDFNEFFQQNNAVADTLSVTSNQSNVLNTLEGATLNIPEDAFDTAGEVSIEVKEATKKSDLIFLNLPTVDGDDWLEVSRAIFMNPFVDGGTSISIDNPLRIETDLPSGTSGENMDFYYFENGWNKDNSIDIETIDNTIFFDTDRDNWQIGGKVFEPNDKVELTIKPVGYGTIPHDMRAFIVLSDYNVVLPMSEDVSAVSASAKVPVGEDFEVVVMVMDHFKLSVGLESFNISENKEVEIIMDLQSSDEMMMTIKSID